MLTLAPFIQEGITITTRCPTRWNMHSFPQKSSDSKGPCDFKYPSNAQAPSDFKATSASEESIVPNEPKDASTSTIQTKLPKATQLILGPGTIFTGKTKTGINCIPSAPVDKRSWIYIQVLLKPDIRLDNADSDCIGLCFQEALSPDDEFIAGASWTKCTLRTLNVRFDNEEGAAPSFISPSTARDMEAWEEGQSSGSNVDNDDFFDFESYYKVIKTEVP